MRASNVYCTLIETLVKAGTITERTRASFVRWVGLKEIAAEGERMVGDEVAEEEHREPEGDQPNKRRIVRRICP